jgi:hypothetical protein
MNSTVAILAVAGIAGAATAQVQLDLRAVVDLSSISNVTTGIGTNPSAVAWNGTDAWVAGYNSSGAAANTGIVRVSGVLSSPTFGTRFGAFSTPNSRGVSGLALQGDRLAISVDTGAGSGDSVRQFSTSTETLNWRIGDATAGNDGTRRGNGVAFDPGFNGAGSNQGVAYLSIGSGRRHLLNASSGAYINGQNAGGIINFATVSTTWRDMAFDPTTGDLYTRESNRIGRAGRTGDNTFSASTVLGSLATATTVDTQNIAFVNSATAGNLLIVNNRTVATGGQAFTSVVQGFTTTGASVPLQFFLNGSAWAAPAGNGAYDFSFDASTNTLAVVDFANRNLYVFQIPTPGAAALLGLGSLVAFRRRR